MFEYDLPYYFVGLPFTSRQVPRKLAWLLARGEIRQVVVLCQHPWLPRRW